MMHKFSSDLVILLKLFSHVSQGLNLPALEKPAFVDVLELESTSISEISLRLYSHLLARDELLEHSPLRSFVSLLLTHPGIHEYVFQTNDFVSYDHFLFQDGGLIEVLERESRRVLEQNGIDSSWDMASFNTIMTKYVEV